MTEKEGQIQPASLSPSIAIAGEPFDARDMGSRPVLKRCISTVEVESIPPKVPKYGTFLSWRKRYFRCIRYGYRRRSHLITIANLPIIRNTHANARAGRSAQSAA
jgi:hypothetical protein